jgi:hypothetical protein
MRISVHTQTRGSCLPCPERAVPRSRPNSLAERVGRGRTRDHRHTRRSCPVRQPTLSAPRLRPRLSLPRHISLARKWHVRFFLPSRKGINSSLVRSGPSARAIVERRCIALRRRSTSSCLRRSIMSYNVNGDMVAQLSVP